LTTDTAIQPKRAEWQALVPLSVGRRGDREKAADLVLTGETVWLTEEESAGYLDRARHRVPVIRPASQKNDPMPRITAANLFGARGRPAPPPAPAPDDAIALDLTNESRIVENTSGPESQMPAIIDPDAGRDGAPVRQVRRGRPPSA
jgi:hypothetical protein